MNLPACTCNEMNMITLTTLFLVLCLMLYCLFEAARVNEDDEHF